MQKRSGTPPPKKTKGRVTLPPLVPSKGSPFEGISGTNAPAKNTKVKDLTEKVTLAKTRREALTHGGLLTPEQQKAASDAGKAVKRASQTAPKASARKLQGVPTPPLTLGAPAPPPTAPASARPVPSLPTGLRGSPFTVDGKQYRWAAPGSDVMVPVSTPTSGRRVSPRQQAVDAQPGQSGFGSLVPGVVKRAAGAVGGELNTGLHDPVGTVINIPTFGVGGPLLHHFGINATNALSREGQKLAPKIATAGEVAGAINKSQLPAGMASQFPGEKRVTEQQIRELEASKGGLGNFPQPLRHVLIEGSVANGWPREDVIKAVDADLMHYYGNKPASAPIQLAKNFGSFAARQASGPAGLVALGDAAVQAAGGNATPLKKQAQQFVEGSTVGLPFISPHGMLHDWYWHPGESAQNLSMVVGGADTLAGKLSHFEPGVARSVTPEGFANAVSRGTLDTRPLRRGIAKTRDAYVNSENPVLNASLTNKRGEVHPLLGPMSPRARRTAVATEAYQQAHERSVAPTLTQSNQLRANLMNAASKVGKERASALNAHLQGADAARAPFYRQVSEELGLVKGRGAKAHAKLSEKHPITEETMTPKDQAYIKAARAAAEFSTATRAEVGQLSADLAGRYRAYQLPIVTAAKTGDALAQRVQRLHNEWTTALAKNPKPQFGDMSHAEFETQNALKPLADEFSSALDDFTQRHVKQGGTTPVYIPQEVPQTLTNAFRRESSVTAREGPDKLKATQDKLIQSGQYRTTASGISLEAHRAAVVKARVAHFQAVDEEFARDAVNGAPHDPNTVVVKADNLRSPIKLANTVGEHNLTDEQVHSTIDQMRMALETGKVDIPPGGYIPAKGHYKVIPKTIYDELHASTQLPKGAPIGQMYDTLNRKYQRFMLSKPSTGGANIVGNPILAMMGGASPLDVIKGYDIIHNRPETLPPQLMGEGLGGAAGQRIARTPFGKFINFSLSHQRASEDAARAALYHHIVGPYVRKAMAETGRSADEILKDLAAGKDANVHQFVKQVEDFLGTMKKSRKMHPGTEQFLSRSILFHRWLGHILTLTLYTMPVKYPGRAVLLQRISEIGDDYRKHHGVYPDWYTSMIPLMQHIMEAGGVPGEFTRVLPTGSIWPTSNLQLPLADSSGANPYGAVISSANPVLKALAEAPTGFDFANLRPYKDSAGAQIGPGLGAANAKLLAGQLYRATPYAGVVTPMPGRSADSFPTNMHNAPHKNKYGRPLPAGYGTTSIPYGGNTPSLSLGYLGGFLSRLALGGSGLQDLPSNTVGTNYADRASLIKARQARQKIIRDTARAKAKAKKT